MKHELSTYCNLLQDTLDKIEDPIKRQGLQDLANDLEKVKWRQEAPIRFYNPAGDLLEVYLKNHGASLHEWIDHTLSLIKDQETGEIVGYQIHGLRTTLAHILWKLIDNYKLEVQDPLDKLMMNEFFLAARFLSKLPKDGDEICER